VNLKGKNESPNAWLLPSLYGSTRRLWAILGIRRSHPGNESHILGGITKGIREELRYSHWDPWPRTVPYAPTRAGEAFIREYCQ
jgi:hypothetical protein